MSEPIHVVRHTCDLARDGLTLRFYLLASRPYCWCAVDSDGNHYTGATRTRLGLRFAIAWAARNWVHAHHVNPPPEQARSSEAR